MEHKEHESEHKVQRSALDTLHTDKSHHQKSETSPNTKMVVMSVLVGLLILVAGVQAYELVGLKDQLSSDLGTLSQVSGKSVSIGASAPASGSLKNNLDSLPSMVGGC